MYQQSLWPGQQPSQSSHRPRQYRRSTLAVLFLLYLCAWICFGISNGEVDPASAQTDALATTLMSLGTISLLVLHGCVLSLDRRNFLTLNGRIGWRSLRGWRMVGLVLAYGGFWIMPPVYLFIVIRDRRKVQLGSAPPAIQSPHRGSSLPVHFQLPASSLIQSHPRVAQRKAIQDEETRPLGVTVPSSRTRVFISYCQKDEVYVRRLKTHFAQYERMGRVEIWDESQIAPGALWQAEIRQAISRTKVALLLVSADYLASRALTENVLPPLLQAAQTEGATILPVIVSACAFADSELARFQAFNRPEKPLSGLSWDEREKAWATVAKLVSRAITPRSARALPESVPPPLQEQEKGFEQETARARQLVLERPDGWQYLLTAELLYTRLLPVRQRLSDIWSGAVSQKSRLMRGDAFFHWAQEKYTAFSSLIISVTALLYTDLPAAWGSAGLAGDPLAIKQIVENVISACQDMLAQELAVRCVLVPDPLATLKQTMQGWAAEFIDQLGNIPARLATPSGQSPVLADVCALREPVSLQAFRDEQQRIQARVKKYGLQVLLV